MKKISLLILFIAVSLSTMGQMTVSFTATNSCNHDGTATATVTGGTAPYSYKWYYSGLTTVIGTGSSLSGLIDGIYRVAVTDANNQIQDSYVKVSPFFTFTVSTTPVTCNNDGAATVTPTGGTAPYTYSWSSGQTTQSISNLSVGSYSTFVTDASGCESHDSLPAHIYSNSSVSLNISNVAGVCNILPSATTTPSGGVAPYTYYWNTTPIQTTATVTGLTADSVYQVIVTDANGCIQIGYVYPYNNTNALSLNTTATPEVCGDHTGTASATPSIGTAPFSYLWNNGMTTQSISGLAKGIYRVTVTDAGGCKSTGSVYVDDTSPIMGYVGSSATCVNGNGTATVNASGGSAPYSYLWSDGQTSSTINTLNYGTYSVVISDVTGCSKTKYAYIEADWSCTYGSVTGIVYNDINGNCIQDAGENGIADAMVYISPGGYGTSTNWDGSYSFYVVPGTYIISHTPLTNWTQICPAFPGTITVNVISAGITYSSNDFGDQVTPGIQDLEAKLYCGGGRPGSTYYPLLVYKNNGGSAMSGTVSFTHSNLVSFYGSYPSANNYNSGTLTAQWNFVNLLPGEERWIEPGMFIPIGTALGTHLNSSVSISPTIGDILLSNNVDSCYGIVIGSYDPNELSVSPQGATNYGYINPSDSVLSYMINFQNTGTDTAFIVVVRDTLNTHLAGASVHDLFASHDVKLNVKGNVLEFTFNNINLLDSAHNEKGSHGFVSFKIKVKKSTPVGTTIPNKADIYFDYNVPVTTNGVMNTLKQNITGILNAVRINNILQVYPNPAHEDFTVSYELPNASSVSLKLFSALGEEKTVMQTTQQNKGINSIRFSAKDNHLSPGVYILKLYLDENILTTKIILTE
ncbi:MAG TPA: T9SS type A sorting domain-containing protein [Cytophagaceae bacterium]|nr:T9SS type A sorting domain-containing protein [Cytophagaceae bacterium]